MRCHVCNAEVGEGQRFCHQCGQSLAGVTDTTQELEQMSDGAPDDTGDDPIVVVPDGPEDDDALEMRADPDDDEADPSTGAVVAAAVGTGAAAAAVAATREVPEAELPGGAATLPTEEVPQAELPGGGAEAPSGEIGLDTAAARSDGDVTVPADPEVGEVTDPSDPAAGDAADFAPPEADAIVAGAIGASLFDPEKAPPAVEPDWGDPIPRLDEGTFDDGRGAPLVDSPADDAVSTTSLPTRDPAAAAPPFDGALASTGRTPVVYDVDADPGIPEPLLDGEIHPFRIRPAFVLSFLGMIAMLMATIADITDIRTDRVVAGIDNRLSTIDDIGTNLAVAGYIGAAVMLVGGLMQCFHLRWGGGLAGGAGLAIVGWAALTIGLAEVPIDAAERITRDPNTPGPFTLTVTRDLGYWLIVALAGVGLVVFLFSLTSAGTGGRRGLNPWTAALGAVAALVVATGPLITVGGADFSVNFGTDNLPAAFFAGRLVQVGLIAVTGVVGFLLVRVYGLGLVAGGISVGFWLWLSSLLELGDRPLGIAAGNLGSSDTTPHAVTTVGMVATLLMLVASAAIAIASRRR